ncbi:S-methyl-5-thioribose kinase [Sporosarcina sp. CAU 1771]
MIDNSHFNRLLEKYKGIGAGSSAIEEIGDGNINYVYRVQAQDTSIIIKEARKFDRSSNDPLDVNRLKIEYNSLKFFGQSTPHLIPELFEYDAENSIMVMEDLKDYLPLRKALAENDTNVLQENHIEQINDFFVDSLLRSTSLLMDYQEKRKLECEFSNPEMCDISERLVFTNPYANHSGNKYTVGMESILAELRTDRKVIDEVLRLKHQFINHKEALIHGDLHSGSIFIKDDQIKILDSEFAVFGPIAYDIGNVLAHLLISKVGKTSAYSNSIDRHIENLLNLFNDKGIASCRENGKGKLVTKSYLESYFKGIISDSYKYAGLEIIRRAIGSAKTAEFESLSEDEKPEVEKKSVLLGKELLIKGQY